MATISVGPKSYLRPYRRSQVRSFPEAASQSFKLGELLVLQTSSDKGNQVKISGADPSSDTVVGIAAQDASGTENTPVSVWIADEESEFVAHVENAMALDADF